MAVTMKNAVFRDITPYGSCNNLCLGEHVASIIRVTRIDEVGTTLAATTNRRTLLRSETSVLTRATLHNMHSSLM
jgi:hypothetical protein